MILLREASNETERNSEATNDRLTIESAKSSIACESTNRRANFGPTKNSTNQLFTPDRRGASTFGTVTRAD